ncbi:restriction endonuclease subunit S [bacterium]|nr:restriction endonuclease subunit S [bacterium]
MAGEWKTVTLADAGVSLIDCDHRTPPEAAFGMPYLTIPQMKNGHLNLKDSRRISEAHFAEWTRKANPQTHDVVVSRRCNPGESGYVRQDMRFALGQNLVLLRSDGETVFPPFLRWLLRGNEWWDQVQKFLNVGAVFDSLRCRDVPNFLLTIPPLHEQKAIAHILGTLDDKIELNRRMNETLEAMARALFKSWFVDFDPVRVKTEAKASGASPDEELAKLGVTPDLAALFPDSFQDSELGEIPAGWNAGTIDDLARYVNGRNFTKGASGTGRMVIRIAELNSGPGGSTVYNDVEAEPDNTAYPDDLLFAWSGSLDVYRWHRDEAVINQHIFKVVCDDYPKWFVYHHLVEAMPFFKDIASHKATTMGHIKRSHLSEARLAIPPKQLLEAIAPLIDPSFNLIHRNTREMWTLEALRDSLLPQLLSGKLSVTHLLGEDRES